MFQSSVLLLFFFFNIKNSSITTSYGELFMVKFSHVFLCYRPIKYSILIQSKLFTENKCHYVVMSFSICWPYLDFGGWVGYEGFSNSLYFSWDTNYSLNFLFYPFCCILKIPKMKIFEKWEISGNAWEYFFKVNIAYSQRWRQITQTFLSLFQLVITKIRLKLGIPSFIPKQISIVVL